jgi:hypothetical protein
MQVVPGTGIEPVRPLFRKAADFKSAVSTNFTTRANWRLCMITIHFFAHRDDGCKKSKPMKKNKANHARI